MVLEYLSLYAYLLEKRFSFRSTTISKSNFIGGGNQLSE